MGRGGNYAWGTPLPRKIFDDFPQYYASLFRLIMTKMAYPHIDTKIPLRVVDPLPPLRVVDPLPSAWGTPSPTRGSPLPYAWGTPLPYV